MTTFNGQKLLHAWFCIYQKDKDNQQWHSQNPPLDYTTQWVLMNEELLAVIGVEKMALMGIGTSTVSNHIIDAWCWVLGGV